MTKLAVRVELHGAKGDAYDRLHDLMAKVHFVRTLEVNGQLRALPPAEYRRTSEDQTSASELASVVYELAKQVHPGGRVSVVTARGDLAEVGEFDPPPLVFHARGAVVGVTKCGISAPADEIRPSELDARAEKGRRGGRLCTLCFV